VDKIALLFISNGLFVGVYDLARFGPRRGGLRIERLKAQAFVSPYAREDARNGSGNGGILPPNPLRVF
jgi:hypothetical protein